MLNKANRPTMRPQRFALCILRYAMVEAAVAALVVLLVVEKCRGTILSMIITRFCRFLKRRNGHTVGHMDGRTDPLIEMRGRI